MYFANILKHRTPIHQRVLIFFRKGDLDATQATFLDQRYAKCFAGIHDCFGISPLAYLRRSEIFKVLAQLPIKQRRALGWCDSLFAYWPTLMQWRWIPVSLLLRKPPRKLAFAVIETDDGTPRVVRFTKKRRDLSITEVTDSAEKEALLALVSAIKLKIFDHSGSLTHSHNFHEFLSR